MKIITYIFAALGIAILLAGTGFALTQYALTDYSPIAVVGAVVTGLLLTIFGYAKMSKGLQKPAKDFFKSISIGMFLKLILGLIGVLIVALAFPQVIDEYVIVFFISYLIFTAFEVYTLMRSLRPENKETSKEA